MSKQRDLERTANQLDYIITRQSNSKKKATNTPKKNISIEDIANELRKQNSK